MNDAERMEQVEELLNECEKTNYVLAYDINDKYKEDTPVQGVLTQMGLLINLFDDVVEEARTASMPIELFGNFINSYSVRLMRLAQEVTDGKWMRAEDWEKVKKELLEWNGK